VIKFRSLTDMVQWVGKLGIVADVSPTKEDQ
jgi:hypothetical protein